MRTREKILETATRLFATSGYRATSLAQVAQAAHVSKALVLWHFESKGNLFRIALQHFLAPYEIDDQVLRGLTESEQLEKLIDDYYEFVAEHLPSVKFVLGQVVRDDENSQEVITHVRDLYRIYCGLLATILERGRERGVFGMHAHPTEDAALMMATLNGLLVQQLIEPDGGEETQEILTHFKRAIRERLCPSSVIPEGTLPSRPSLSGAHDRPED